MIRLDQIEEYLRRETKFAPYPATREEQTAWLIENADYAKSLLFKLRGFGKLAWKNYLWAYGLEEKTVLTRCVDPREEFIKEIKEFKPSQKDLDEIAELGEIQRLAKANSDVQEMPKTTTSNSWEELAQTARLGL